MSFQTMYNVREFGALADGVANDAPAIQRAIDAASSNGGGVVIVPAGRYYSGAIYLRSNIVLDFLPGAELLASSDPLDYPATFGSPMSRYRNADGSDTVFFSSLLYGQGVKNVVIKGGSLLADAQVFWKLTHRPDEDFEPAHTAQPWFYYKANTWRIKMMLFEECENIIVEGTEISSYPAYAGWFVGCNHLSFSRINIHSDLSGPNTDGLHFTSCRDIIISDSWFYCGDDCIAIDGNHNGPSSDFVITNCTFHTSVHAFRIYTGIDPGIRENGIPSTVSRVSISNCTVSEAAGIFSIGTMNGKIDSINATNITASLLREGTPFSIATKNGSISNVRLSGLNVVSNGCGFIWSEKPGDICDIFIYDSNFDVTPKTKLCASVKYLEEFPDHCHFRTNNFCFRRANNVMVKNISVHWQKPEYSDKWTTERRNALIQWLGNIPLSDLEPKAFPAFEIIECENLVFDGNSVDDFCME